jgi:hypothetical protein
MHVCRIVTVKLRYSSRWGMQQTKTSFEIWEKNTKYSNIALIKVLTSTPATDQTVPKERKKEVRVDILIISVSLVAFAFIVLAISGIVIYRSRVFAYKSISNNMETLS